jgi:hypothetical protein
MVSIMKRAVVVLVVSATVFATSCQPIPELKVRATALPNRELGDRAPIVVVGKVRETKVVGPEVRTTDEHSYPLRLRQVTVEAENVIKGQVSAGEVVFYRYDWSPDHAMVGPWGILGPGTRYVLFLDREDGELRSMADLYPSHIEVRSGRHAGHERREEKSVEESIAELLLTPGADVQPETFSQGLDSASFYSIDLIGDAGTLRLMKRLLASDDPLVRRRACDVISGRFPGQVQCSSKGVN